MWLLYLGLSAGITLSGQQMIPVGNVLASAANAPRVAATASHLAFRQQSAPELPWLERVEVRSETDRFELRRQEYLTRFSMNGIQEKRLYKALQSSERAIVDAEQQQYFLDALAERYNFLAAYFSLQAALSLREELAAIYRDRINVLGQLMAAGVKTDADDLVKAEYELDDLHLQQMEDTAELELVLRQLAAAMAMDSISGVDTAARIQPLQLRMIVADATSPLQADPLESEYTAQIQALQTEDRLENAEASQVLDFFQMRYANRPNEPWRSDIALSLGIRLPYSGSGKAKMAEIAIEQHAVSTDLEIYRAERKQAIQIALRELDLLERQYLRHWQMLRESDQRYDQAAMLARGAEGVLAHLQFREAQIKRRLRLEEIAADMLKTYLHVLTISGRLSARPFINYLSAGLDPVVQD